MFEGQLAFYLNKYLGQYVHGLDPESLRISVWKGDIVLKNLKLRPEALDAFKLPITVKAGTLGTLRLKIPWAALGKQQVEVELDRIYVLAVPNYLQTDSAPDVASPEEEEALQQKRKMQLVDALERAWVENLRQQSAQHVEPGRIQAYVNLVLGNLKFTVTNLHVRYEDSITQPGHPFAVGLTMHSISAHTVDENGNVAFVYENALQLLRKAAKLARLTIYFDTDVQTLWHDGKSWNDLAVEDWDKLFVPGIKDDQGAEARQYVLQPVDGTARYVRRAKKDPEDVDKPYHDVVADWAEFALRFSQNQYANVQMLLQELSRHQLRRPHEKFRPPYRPAGTGAQAWWRYAFKAVCKRLRKQDRLSWFEVVVCAQSMPEYVALYVDRLAAERFDGLERLGELDRRLPEQVILHFRKLAHKKHERAAAQHAQHRPQPEKRTWGSWLGIGRASDSGAESASGDGGSELEKPDVTDDELAKLDDLARQHNVELTDEPRRARLRLTLLVKQTSVVLTDDAGVCATLASSALETQMTSYSSTRVVRCSVQAASVSLPGCELIRTGNMHADDSAAFLVVRYTSNPWDSDLDHDLDARIAPAYVTYIPAAVRRVAAFARTQTSVDLTALSARARARVQEMQSIARQQLQDAWSQKPKIRINVDLQAPKVAVPIALRPDEPPDRAATLLLDLGSLHVGSNRQEQATLSPEEAAIYDCYTLRSSNLAVFFVNGEFRWPESRGAGGAVTARESTGAAANEYLGRGAVGVPVLERISTQASVHVAHAAHPSLPSIRVALSVDSVAVHVSPARIRQLLRVMHTVLPPSAVTPDAAPWIKSAEYTGTVDVLTWSGLAGSAGHWQPQYAVTYRGTLYLLQSEKKPVILRQVSLWQGRRITPMRPEHVSGMDNVIAVAPLHLALDRILEEPAAVLIRLQSEYMVKEWVRRLRHSASQMHAVANWQDSRSKAFDVDDSLTTATPSLGLRAKSSASPSVEVASAPPEDRKQDAPGVTTLVAVTGRLTEVCLHVSGRTVGTFWPPTDVSAPPEGATVQQPSTDAMIADERPLVDIKAQGSVVKYTQSLGNMAVGVKLRRFVIEDCLVGPLNKDLRYLARSFTEDEEPQDLQAFSSLPGVQPAQVSDMDMAAEEVIDEERADGGGEQRGSGAEREEGDDDEEMRSACSDLDEASSASATLDPAASDQPMQLLELEEAIQQAELDGQELATIHFQMWDAATCPSYDNVDMELSVQVAALYFFCNRPTVAALMAYGTDCIDPAASAARLAAIQEVQMQAKQGSHGSSSSSNQSDLGANQPGDGHASPANDAVTLSGGEQRVVFRLSFAVKELALTLMYEGYNLRPMAQASVSDFDLDLSMHPDTLRLTSTLGNVEVLDGALPDDNPYKCVCGLREGTESSLIELTFRMHSVEESFSEPRVPDNSRYYSLQSKLSAVTIAYLNRFLQEFLQYINLLFALQPSPLFGRHKPHQPPPRKQLPPAASSSAPPSAADAAPREAAQQAANSGAPVFMILLDVHMEAPVIEMPRHSESGDSLEVDLGVLDLSNAVSFVSAHGLEAEPSVIDTMDIQLKQVSACMLQDGEGGDNLIRELGQGVALSVKRALKNVGNSLPTYDCHIDVPHVVAAVTDQEYSFCCAVAISNLAEPMRLPVAALWLQDNVKPASTQSPQRSAGEATVSDAQRNAAHAEQHFSHDMDAGLLGNPGLRATLSFGAMLLELSTTDAAAPNNRSLLASLQASDMYICYCSLGKGHMDVQVCVPRLESRDLRSSRVNRSSLVLSSGAPSSAGSQAGGKSPDEVASLLTLNYCQMPSGAQHVTMRLQRPTVVAEVDFALALLKFAVPSFSLGLEPQKFADRDIRLDQPVTVADDHLWLSPDNRLLADCPEFAQYVYDGAGHSIVLPPKMEAYTDLPLIAVGPCTTLHLKHVTIVNAEALASCLHLAAGACLKALPEDGVVLQHSTAQRSSGSSTQHPSLRAAALAVAASAPGGEPRRQAFLQVNFQAVGMGLHLITPAKADDGPSRGGRDNAQLLAAYMDVQASYYSRAEKDTANLCVSGLRVESQVVNPVEDGLGDVPALRRDVSRKGEGLVQGHVMEPANINLTYMSTHFAQEVAIELSDMNFNLSPDMIQLVDDIRHSLLAPLSPPAYDRPLCAVFQYTKVWSSHAGNSITPPFTSGVGSGGLDVLGRERGFTFWVPVVPPGYCAIGHVLVAGTAQPMYDVVSVALNSGIVAWPLSYDKVWSADGVTVWQPVAPPHFAAMGCVATKGEEPPPVKNTVVCLHAKTLVEVDIGECLVRSDQGCMWAVENAGACFMFTSELTTLPSGNCYDLRNPVGVITHSARGGKAPPTTAVRPDNAPSNGLAFHTPTGAAQHQAYEDFVLKSEKRQKDAQDVTTYFFTPQFKRVWSNKGVASSRATPVSVWRPVGPDKFASVGDCISIGSYLAPRCAVVLLEGRTAMCHGNPLLAPPIGYEFVWRDLSAPEHAALSVWRPRAPEDYVTLGFVCIVGPGEPPLSLMRCVHRSAVAPSANTYGVPFMTGLGAAAADDGLSVWITDDSACTFVAARGSPPEYGDAWALNVFDNSRDAKYPGRTKPFTLHVTGNRFCLQVRDIFRVPLLELESSNLVAKVSISERNITTANVEALPEIWSYHAALKAWEPVLSPCKLVVDYKGNPTSKFIDSVLPGALVEVTSPDAVQLTLAAAAVDDVLNAYVRFSRRPGAGGGALQKQAVAADHAAVRTEVVNQTGLQLQMWMDFGEAQHVQDVPTGVAHVVQPLAQPVSRSPQTLRERTAPTILVSVTVTHISLPPKGAATASSLRGRELYVTAKIGAQDPRGATYDGAHVGVRTRALRGSPSEQLLPVHETFLLELPEKMAGQLAEDLRTTLQPTHKHGAGKRAPEQRLVSGLSVTISAYDQGGHGARDCKGALLATATTTLSPQWVLQAALSAALATEAASTGVKAVTRPGEPGPLTLQLWEATSDAPEGHRASAATVGDVEVLVKVQRVHYRLANLHRHDGGRGVFGEDASERGRRSLRIPAIGPRWAPLLQQSAQLSTTAGSGAGVGAGHTVIGVDLADGIAVEESFVGAMRRNTIRSLCQVINDLDFAVQLCVTLQAGSNAQLFTGGTSTGVGTFTGVAPSDIVSICSGGRVRVSNTDTSTALIPEVEEDEVFENERYMPLAGFRPGNLLPLDPCRYSRKKNGSQSSDTFPEVRISRDWEWEGPWELEKGYNTDSDGWCYAVDFSQLAYPFQGSAKPKLTLFCRRRRWTRRRRRVQRPLDSGASSSQTTGGPSHQGTASNRSHEGGHVRVVLGVINAGEKLAIPCDYLRGGHELQLRPVLTASGASQGASADGSLHQWSVGASNGDHSVLLSVAALGDANGQQRLLFCAPGPAPASGMPAAAASSGPRTVQLADLMQRTCYISAKIEASALACTSSYGVLQDWRICLAPPLTIHNLLPVPSEYSIWELPRPGSPMALRQTGEVGAGDTLAVYAADVRTQVSFQFVPKGYEWAEEHSTLLSLGYSSHSAGVSGPQQLPSALRVRNHNTNVPLRVLIEREIDNSRFDAAESIHLDPGAAVALGCSMLVRVYVPIWVVNLTKCMVSAALVMQRVEAATPVAAARRLAYESGDPEQSARGRNNYPKSRAVRNEDMLDILECRQRVAAPPPSATFSHCQILPGSCELLSHSLEVSWHQQQAAAASSSSPQEPSPMQVGLQLCALGAFWSPVLLLAGAGASSDFAGDARVLQHGRPLLMRAHVPQTGVVQDIVVRLQAAEGPFGRCQVLHLEPHIIISNRTGLPLQLRREDAALARSKSSFKAKEPGIMLTAGSHGELLTASPMPEMTHHPQVQFLPPGTAGVPLNFATQQRVFSLALSSPSTTSTSPFWSNPMAVQYPGGVTAYLEVPVAEHSLAEHSGRPQRRSEATTPRAATAADVDAAVVMDFDRETAISLLSEPSGKGVSRNKTLLRQVKEWKVATEGTQGVDVVVEEAVCIAVRISIEVHSPGCLHIVAESAGCEPPYLIQNRTPHTFLYRQADQREPWHRLMPYSAVGFAWPHLISTRAKMLELMAANERGKSVKLALDDPSSRDKLEDEKEEGGGLGALEDRKIEVRGKAHLLTTSDIEDGVMTSDGLGPIGMYGEGATRMGQSDRCLVISAATSSETISMMALEQYCATVGAVAARAVRTRLSLEAVEISVVDRVPEELVVASLDKLAFSYDYNVGAGARLVHMGLKLAQVQVDDEQWNSPMPVVLVGLPLPASPNKPMPDLLSFDMLSEVAPAQGRRRIPIVSLEVSRPLQIAVSEQLAWRLLELYSSLGPERLARKDDPASSATGQSVDPVLDVSFLSISDLQGKCFFRADPTTRPRKAYTYVPESYMQMVPEALDSVKLFLDGFEFVEQPMQPKLKLRQSLLWGILKARYRGQILSFGLSLLYSALGFFGTSMTGQVLGVASDKVKGLVGDKKKGDASRRQEITNLAEGVTQGVFALGDGVFKGLKGVVYKPLKGAKKRGATGFLKGLAQGTVGIVANPVSGALEAVSSGLYGINATLNTLSGGSEIMMSRRRIQRSVRGDRVLRPMDFNDALGQQLLRMAAEDDARRPSSSFSAVELYEHYEVLPRGMVVVLTSRRVMLVHAPEFAAVVGAYKAGNSVSIDRLTPGELQWSMEWDDVLATELIYRQGVPHPLKLVLHSRDPRGPLLHELECDASTKQAEAIQLLVQTLLHKYVDEARRRYDHDILEGDSAPEDSAVPKEEGQMLPAEMPSIEWKLILLTPALDRCGDVASIWRPVGPARYCRLGDVIRKGREPPAAPVSMYLDDSRGGDPRAAFAAPVSFDLVWRDYEGRVTLWRPKSPEGYVSIGCLAAKGFDAPSPSSMRCVRQDLVKSTVCWTSPTWWAVSSDVAAWPVTCWQIDAPSNAFWAVRSHHLPPKELIKDVNLSNVLPALPEGSEAEPLPPRLAA